MKRRAGSDGGRTATDWVPEIVERLVAGFQPLQILLFGSQARGDASPDSDVDLLVVLPRITNKRETLVAVKPGSKPVIWPSCWAWERDRAVSIGAARSCGPARRHSQSASFLKIRAARGESPREAVTVGEGDRRTGP
ncbi:MAG: nucleotidyltransferase domain-containing protein [Bacillota bacterium]